MELAVEVNVNAPAEAVWNIITDFENAADNISAIEELEILETPESGLVGTKWKETRTMFGKTATEEMWITEAVDGESYTAAAESHGCRYRSVMSVTPQGDGSVLKMTFGGQAVSFGAKVMMILMGWMMKGASRKAILQDLEDIKKVAEGNKDDSPA